MTDVATMSLNIDHNRSSMTKRKMFSPKLIALWIYSKCRYKLAVVY